MRAPLIQSLGIVEFDVYVCVRDLTNRVNEPALPNYLASSFPNLAVDSRGSIYKMIFNSDEMG